MPMLPPVIFIPGLACAAQLWAAQAASLSQAGWSVAHSDVGSREPSLPRMAQALLAEHPGRLVLAGASMGAMVALHAALQAPDRVAALVLVGASARADDADLRQLRADAIEHFEQGDVEPFLRANAMLVLHPRQAADPAMLEAYLAMVLRAGAAQLVAQNRAVMDRPDLRPQLAALRCPVLLMVGETDAVTPPDHAREIAGAVPGATLHVIDGAGHLPTIETPERVNALLRPWLSALR
jgi:pimeloyl-ACP methyl ester carboxylesterase